MTEHIKTTTQDGVLEISFARPEKKNALSNAMYRKATDALENAQTDAAIRVVMLSGEGDVFTSGNDISDFAGAAAGGSEELQAVAQALVQTDTQGVVPGGTRALDSRCSRRIKSFDGLTQRKIP